MLVSGESFNERKAFILSCIVTSRKFIQTMVNHYHKYPSDLLIEGINLEKQNLKSYIDDLVELKRWFKTQDMAEDEGYMFPSVRAKLAAMTPEERDAWEEQQLQYEYRLQQLYDEYYIKHGRDIR